MPRALCLTDWASISAVVAEQAARPGFECGKGTEREGGAGAN